MGEWTCVSIRFGGKIARNDFNQLAEALHEGGWNITDYDSAADTPEELRAALLAGKTLLNRTNYGTFDELEPHIPGDLDYHFWCDSGHEWAEQWEKRSAGRFETCTTDGTNALIPLNLITAKDQMVKGWADLIDLARFWAADLPPLEITDGAG